MTVPPDFEAVRGTVTDVIDAMWCTDPRDHLFVREGWPAASCEHVAVAVAAVLADRRLGSWTFVTASRPGEENGHAWLELHADDGSALFSIDPTLHQFDQWAAPFVGEGPTPAAGEFSQIRWRGVIWEWPWLGGDDQTFRRLIRAVREQLKS